MFWAGRDLQGSSGPNLNRMIPAGIEPTTSGLSAPCSVWKKVGTPSLDGLQGLEDGGNSKSGCTVGFGEKWEF